MNKIYTVLKGRSFVGMKLMLLVGMMMGGVKANAQTTLANYLFENNLTVEPGAIGSPTLTASTAVSYFGGVTGQAVAYATSPGKYFDVIISTTGYSTIKIGFAGRSSQTGSTWIITGDPTGGTTFGAITSLSCPNGSFSSLTPTLLGASYDNVSSIRIRITAGGTSATLRLDDLLITGVVIASTPIFSISGTTAHGSVCPATAAGTQSYTITNSGTVASNVTVTSDNPEFVVSGYTPGSIAASGGTATYSVTFTPSGAGAKTATITVLDVPTSASKTSPLTGTGLTSATAAVTTTAAASVVNTTAVLNGNVTTLGVCPSTTEKGFVYSQTSINSNPVVAGTGVTKTSVAGIATGTYTLALSSLTPNTGYTFKAYVWDGATYTYGAPQTFTTLQAASKLGFTVAPPSTGNIGSNLTSFSIAAQRPDGTTDIEYTGNITIAKASGPGNLTGTLTVAATAGVATLSAAQFDAVGTYTIVGSSGILTTVTSGNIVISIANATNIIFSGASVASNCNSGASGSWVTNNNWCGGALPSATTIAQFGASGTNASIIFNMNTPPAGSTTVGAIEISGANSTARTLSNSSPIAAGTLTLNGVVVNLVPNVIMRNNSATAFIINNGSNTLNIGLGNTTENIINTDATGGITISTVITGSNPLTKAGTGSGILSLTGVNTYTGATSINAGVLNPATITNGGVAGGIGASANAASNLVLGGGTLQYTGATTATDRNFTLTAATTSTFELTNTLTISGGAASTTGALTKTGAGILQLTGSNLYTGLTTVSAGTLQLNKTGGTTIPITNNVTVSGGTLQISKDQTLNNVILNTGSIVVDAGITLTINGTLTIAGAGTVSGTIAYGPTGNLVYSNGAARNIGAEWPATAYPYNVSLSGAGTVITLNASRNTANNFTVDAAAILTGTGFTLTVGGDWNVGSAAGYAAGINPASAVIFTGTGIRSFVHTGGATFRNVSFTGTGNYTVSNDIAVSVNTLLISAGTVNMGTNTLNGSGDLTMTGGTLLLGKLNTTLPELTGTFTISGGTVELSGAGTQTLKGARSYYNLTFSGGGTKGVSSAINLPGNTIAGTVTVADLTTLDVGSTGFGNSVTNLTLLLTGKFVNGGSGVKPDIGGTYTLGTGSTVEFSGSSATEVRISPSYYNLLISGTNVSTSTNTAVINFQSGGTFTVTGTFKTRNAAGLSGTTSSSVNSTNSPNVVLATGSSIDYSEPITQTITNQSSYYNLTISSTGIKNAPATILTLMGDFTKSAAAIFSHDSGTVAFLGTAPQAYNSSASITDFYNVTTSNAAGLTINNNMSIAGELALTGSANLNLAAGDITLKSSSTKTASFAALPATASVTYVGTGLFSVERFINASRKWRFLSVNTATTQSINAAWQEGQTANANGNAGHGVIITDASATAPGINGFDQSSFTPSMKYFDPAINDYTGVVNTSDNIAAHDAYMTYVRGDRTCTPGNSLTATTLLRTKGTLKTGDQTYTVTNAGDFAAIGNPYASRVSISNLQMTGLQDYIYIWDPKIAGAYSLGGFQTLQKISGVWKFPISLGGSYPSGINVPMDSIESGQAFFVRAQAAGASITFKESSKAAGSHDVNFTAGQPASLIAVLKNAAGEGVDAAAVQYDDQNSNSINFGDALKMSNTSENVSIKSSALLAIEQRKNVTATDTVHLNVTGYKVGSYQWNFKLINMDAPGLTAFVKDNFLNTLSPLNMNGDNNISFTISSAADSYAADRFSVIFRPASVVAVTLNSIAAQRLADKSVKVSWRSENEAGIDHYEIQLSEEGITFSSLARQAATNNAGGTASYSYNDLQPYAGVNYYRVKAVSISGAVSYTAVVKLAPVNEKASFSVSPNPVKDKLIRLQAVAQAPGDYKVQLINNAGQVVYKGLITVSGSTYVQRIQLPANTAAGNYLLSVTDLSGKVTSEHILIE
jgi:autotransporter-associated beta strand protein